MRVVLKFLFPILILCALFLYESNAIENVAMTSFMDYYLSAESSRPIFLLALLLVPYILLSRLNGYRIKNKTTAEKSILGFLIYIYIISLLWSMFLPFLSHTIYITALLPILFYYAFHYLFSSVKTKYIHDAFIIFFILMVVQYVLNYSQIHLLGSDTTSNNASYFILYLIPFVMCLENKYIKYLFLVIAGIIIVSSFKRGGTIAYLFACIVYYYVNNIGQKNSIKKVWYIIILICAVLCLYLYLFSSDSFLINHLFDRFVNIKQDNGSGRTDAFSTTVRMFANSDLISMIFGHGWNMVERDSPLGISAHNDILECLYDFGIIGLILFFNVVRFFYKYYRQLYRIKSEFAAPFAASGVIYFCNAMVSHVIIYPYYMVFFSIFWTYIFVLTTLNKKAR